MDREQCCIPFFQMLNLLMERLGLDGNNHSLVQYHFENNTFGKSEKRRNDCYFYLFSNCEKFIITYSQRIIQLCIQIVTSLRPIFGTFTFIRRFKSGNFTLRKKWKNTFITEEFFSDCDYTFLTCCIDTDVAVFGCKSTPYSSARGGLFGSCITNLAPAFLLNLLSM